MNPSVIWKGTDSEGSELRAILERNCTCSENGGRRILCPGHDALVHSQKFVDGLLFIRSRREKLNAEEFAANDE